VRPTLSHQLPLDKCGDGEKDSGFMVGRTPSRGGSEKENDHEGDSVLQNAENNKNVKTCKKPSPLQPLTTTMP